MSPERPGAKGAPRPPRLPVRRPPAGGDKTPLFTAPVRRGGPQPLATPPAARAVGRGGGKTPVQTRAVSRAIPASAAKTRPNVPAVSRGRPAGPRPPPDVSSVKTTPRARAVPAAVRPVAVGGEKPVAVILAAGASRRMGSPKALLKLEGLTFLQACLRTFQRVRVAPLVVLGADAELIAAAHPRLSYVRNHAWPSGQFSSVRTGLRAALAQGATSVLIHPVDAPRLHWSTVAALHDALHRGHPVAVPFNGRVTGHPLALTAQAARFALASDATNLWSAVSLLQPRRVRVRDAGAFENVNDAAQYRKLLGRS
jgi:molybdenum cofactor cytidylyltransferase